ncbi:c-type cytochrome [Fodinibius halophilus]|uniref:Cytochrome c n=1 Tax=Fodinibius halophilus TaxID=1736908 RepID=A0A6M1TCE1_9BACT|nr:cytochrome c [Fodinibius halophilus]NGP90033.1 cytochrome c [Fodinibius halophilus]
MQKIISVIILLFIAPAILVISCNSSEKAEPTKTIEGRWFTQKQYTLGKQVFTNNCAQCHGQHGEGTVEDWKQRNADGSFPPPPLNGSAHTWHHPFKVLMKTINKGGKRLGGTMPAFEDKLSREEKVAVIAYFQSLWDDKTYNRWVKMNARQSD